jgi:hypothetical protein
MTETATKIRPMPSTEQEKYDPNPDPTVWNVPKIRQVQAALKRAELLNDFEEIERLSQISRKSLLLDPTKDA